MHWVVFTAMITGFGYYFMALILWKQEGGTPPGHYNGLFLTAIIAITTIIIIGAILSAIANPKEAQAQEDERDKFFHRTGAYITYYPLILALWAVIIAITLWEIDRFWIIQALLAVVVTAEIIRIGVQLIFYRRGL